LKVLLTGASGFVGSHILDALGERKLPVAILLRPSSDRQFIQGHLPTVEIRSGSIADPESLASALAGITHVIHCAGCTRAVHTSEFYRINQIGTRNMVEAVNAHRQTVRRLIHVSSLAAAGPATADRPKREEDPPQPVSEYGRSKLAAEEEVRARCRVDHVILRPPAVYGPRDHGFLSMFKAVWHHLRPLPSGRQVLSLVYVKDLAEAICHCLDHPNAVGKTFFAAAREVVTGRAMAREIAAQVNHWTIPCPLPGFALWPLCLVQDVWARLTRRARLLNLAKYPELVAPGWVCDPTRLERELGFSCSTPLRIGVGETLKWYQDHQWL
jgi:nucleoside-diphosphate-sugar epimerase